jgi:hypothetical protein
LSLTLLSVFGAFVATFVRSSRRKNRKPKDRRHKQKEVVQTGNSQQPAMVD